ncbi:MAG: hypothetical protein KVP17_000565 [Porospora cf. gigantea B]|uniref:uncharacterized protein n=1 Tax=Porospora cf. gigantea B TaxID=2853592 RepID=UPI003571B621|nr:MAG: hypothetical protein KVP17_000565 [Porospora cf. gigantea B]
MATLQECEELRERALNQNDELNALIADQLRLKKLEQERQELVKRASAVDKELHRGARRDDIQLPVAILGRFRYPDNLKDLIIPSGAENVPLGIDRPPDFEVTIRGFLPKEVEPFPDLESVIQGAIPLGLPEQSRGVKCHKRILKSLSSMMYDLVDRLDAQSVDRMEIRTVDPSAVVRLINFAYHGPGAFTGMPPLTLLTTWMEAIRFQITRAMPTLERLIAETTHIPAIVMLLDLAKHLQRTALYNELLTTLAGVPQLWLSNGVLATLDPATVAELINRDDISVKESELMAAMHMWLLKREDVWKDSGANLVVYESVRFCLLNLEEVKLARRVVGLDSLILDGLVSSLSGQHTPRLWCWQATLQLECNLDESVHFPTRLRRRRFKQPAMLSKNLAWTVGSDRLVSIFTHCIRLQRGECLAIGVALGAKPALDNRDVVYFDTDSSAFYHAYLCPDQTAILNRMLLKKASARWILEPEELIELQWDSGYFETSVLIGRQVLHLGVKTSHLSECVSRNFNGPL